MLAASGHETIGADLENVLIAGKQKKSGRITQLSDVRHVLPGSIAKQDWI